MSSTVTAKNQVHALDAIIEAHKDRPGALLGILEEAQGLEEHRYLPEEALRRIAEKTGAPLSTVYSVATFYSFFNLTPQGKHSIVVCRGTACHTRGSLELLETALARLGIEGFREDECNSITSKDAFASVRTVACFGQCALAPVVRDRRHHLLAHDRGQARGGYRPPWQGRRANEERSAIDLGSLRTRGLERLKIPRSFGRPCVGLRHRQRRSSNGAGARNGGPREGHGDGTRRCRGMEPPQGRLLRLLFGRAHCHGLSPRQAPPCLHSTVKPPKAPRIAPRPRLRRGLRQARQGRRRQDRVLGFQDLEDRVRLGLPRTEAVERALLLQGTGEDRAPRLGPHRPRGHGRVPRRRWLLRPHEGRRLHEARNP